ncbi:MAG: ArsR family transcriptional regulator [Nanoarchaeota archaeon]|nr:ArsR family transcriptional regulator [Nanoarchaeota archaeon]
MKILKKENEKNYVLDTKEISLDKLNGISNKMSKNILNLISKNTMYPKEIAKKLKVHEQNIYYYIKKLEKADLIKIVKQENINGTYANYYKTSCDSFHISFNEFKETSKLHSRESKFLSPFIDNGRLNCLIIVGSPDPHGPQKARSRDGYFGLDLALFLGTYLNQIPNSSVKLDTEVSDEDLKINNLIVIGGPIVNKVSSLINAKMPIRFDEEKKGILSILSNKTYFEDEIGIINKIKNPFNPKKEILFLAGMRNSGTKTAILSFLKYFEKIESPNLFDKKSNAKVVLGLDMNSDGQIDDVEFLE